MKKKTKEVTTKYTWKFWGLVIGEITFIVIFILLFAVAISLGVYVYQQQYEPDDLFVKVGEGILDNAPEIFSGEPKEVQELRKQEVADTDTQGLRQE